MEALKDFDNNDRVVIEVYDTVLDEDLYSFYVDPIDMELDKDGNHRGYEIRFTAIPHDNFSSTEE